MVRGRLAAQLAMSQRPPEGPFADRRGRVALGRGGALEPASRLDGVAGGAVGATEQELDLVLRRQQVPALAEVRRVGPGRLEAGDGVVRTAVRQRAAGEGHVRDHPLAGHEALAALPGVEAAGPEDLQGVVVAPELVEQGDSLDGQVVAGSDEPGLAIERGQPRGRVFAETLAQLVELVEQAGVAGGRAAGTHVGCPGGDRSVPDVVLGDAEIALHDREARVVRGRATPGPDRVVVPAAVVQQVAEVVRRAGIGRVKQLGGLEDPDLLEAGRKAVVGGVARPRAA